MSTGEPNVIEALCSSGAYGYPRGSLRNHLPHIIAVVHQTATAGDAALSLMRQRNVAGYSGNTATYYVNADGTAYHFVDGTRYASWCSAPSSIAYLDTSRVSIAAVYSHFQRGFNPNECVWEQFEVCGGGSEPWDDAQFDIVAQLIAKRAALCGLPINRDTVVPHRDFDTVNRPSDPWPAATREARMARLIALAQAYAGKAPEEDMQITLVKFEDWLPTVGTQSNGVLRGSPERSAAIIARVPAGTTVRSIAEIKTNDLANPDWRLTVYQGKPAYMLRPDWTPLVSGGDPKVNADGLAYVAGGKQGHVVALILDGVTKATLQV